MRAIILAMLSLSFAACCQDFGNNVCTPRHAANLKLRADARGACVHK
jgi:hypothetical protein